MCSGFDIHTFRNMKLSNNTYQQYTNTKAYCIYKQTVSLTDQCDQMLLVVTIASLFFDQQKAACQQLTTCCAHITLDIHE